VTKYGNGSVCKCGCAGAGDGVVALNRVHSETGVCSVQSAAERRVVTFRVVCRKHGVIGMCP